MWCCVYLFNLCDLLCIVVFLFDLCIYMFISWLVLLFYLFVYVGAASLQVCLNIYVGGCARTYLDFQPAQHLWKCIGRPWGSSSILAYTRPVRWLVPGALSTRITLSWVLTSESDFVWDFQVTYKKACLYSICACLTEFPKTNKNLDGWCHLWYMYGTIYGAIYGTIYGTIYVP